MIPSPMRTPPRGARSRGAAEMSTVVTNLTQRHLKKPNASSRLRYYNDKTNELRQFLYFFGITAAFVSIQPESRRDGLQL